jgi:hypothetical protein
VWWYCGWNNKVAFSISFYFILLISITFWLCDIYGITILVSKLFQLGPSAFNSEHCPILIKIPIYIYIYMLLVIYFHPTHALDRHKLVPPTMHIIFPHQMWCMPCLFRMLIPLLTFHSENYEKCDCYSVHLVYSIQWTTYPPSYELYIYIFHINYYIHIQNIWIN